MRLGVVPAFLGVLTGSGVFMTDFWTDPRPTLLLLILLLTPLICLKGVELDDALLTFLFSPPPKASFSLGFGEGAMIKLVLEAAATVSGAAMGFPPVPNLLNDWGILLYFASDGGEANPRGRIFTFDDGDARYVEIFVEETGRMFLLSLWLIAVIADE
jgi:hypothetical protein